MAYYNQAHGHPQGQYPSSVVYYPGPTINYQQAVIKNFGPHYERQSSTGLGATQIVLACVSIAAGIMAIVYDAECYEIGVGIWAGAWYLIAGSLAIAAGKDPTNSLISATLFFSVFGFLIGITELSIAAVGLTDDVNCSYSNMYCPNWREAAIAANSIIVGVGTLGTIFGIWMTVLSGCAVDKGSKAQMVILPVTYAQHQPEAMFIQAPSALQPQPPPYNAQQQYPSISNPQQQMMYVGVHQAPLTTVKS